MAYIMEQLRSLLFIFICCLLTVGVLGGPYNVCDYGAVGDGNTDDTKAFLATWDATCADTTDATFWVPNGKTFLLGLIQLKGPCKSAIHIRVDGNILRPKQDWSSVPQWIKVSGINGLTIDGSGQFDAQGDVHWPCKLSRTCNHAPNTLFLRDNDNVVMDGLKFINSSQMHIVVGHCTNVSISHLNIIAPGNSPNTDGIHIQRSRDVYVQHSIIGTGDDCISIETGTININVYNITCGPGHGISIGSLGDGQSEGRVEQIRVMNSTINGATSGVRIKTWQGGSGYAKNILFQNINIIAVPTPIVIDQFYFCLDNCTILPSAVKISDVKYIGITGTSAGDVAINFKCSDTVPCEGIVVEDVNIHPAAVPADEADVPALTSNCQNVLGYKKGVIVPDVPCLSTTST